jgi:Domain of unknown function (DUF4382)
MDTVLRSIVLEMVMQRISAFVFASMLGAAACNNSPSSSPSGQSALFNLRLTDSPFSDARAVLVTFSEVTAHRSDSDWTKVPFAGGATSRTCDLKKLENSEDILGTGPLPPGDYTQVRVVVQSARLYFDHPADGPACAATIAPPDGRMSDLRIPSGEVKLNRGFKLTSEATTTMLLDFDGDRSIHQTGNGTYMMSPVIGITRVN